jgi:hypothetical protein
MNSTAAAMDTKVNERGSRKRRCDFHSLWNPASSGRMKMTGVVILNSGNSATVILARAQVVEIQIQFRASLDLQDK